MPERDYVAEFARALWFAVCPWAQWPGPLVVPWPEDHESVQRTAEARRRCAEKVAS